LDLLRYLFTYTGNEEHFNIQLFTQYEQVKNSHKSFMIKTSPYEIISQQYVGGCL